MTEYKNLNNSVRNDMSIKHDVLIELLDVFSNSRIQIDRILFEYEEEIQKFIIEVRNTQDSSPIYSLFKIQNDLSLLAYKYNYPLSNFLHNFIYEFDRQDDESVTYLVNKIVNNESFLIN